VKLNRFYTIRALVFNDDFNPPGAVDQAGSGRTNQPHPVPTDFAQYYIPNSPSEFRLRELPIG
jgi:hypothetical protein